MAAPEGNKNGLNNRGGGRLKSGDVQKLLDLWEGRVDINKLKVIEKVVEYTDIFNEPVIKKIHNTKGRPKEVVVGYKSKSKKLKKIRTSFGSGFEAFAYRVLTGDDRAVKSLIDKLYADQRNVKFEDDSLPTSDKLKQMPTKDLKQLKKELLNEEQQRE